MQEVRLQAPYSRATSTSPKQNGRDRIVDLTSQPASPRPPCACREYGCNVCGEGGEYETLVMDCPPFRHARVVMDEWQTRLHSPDTFAPVGVLHPVRFHTHPKGLQAQPTADMADGEPAPAQPQAAEAGLAQIVAVPQSFDPAPMLQQPQRGSAAARAALQCGTRLWQGTTFCR